MHTLVHLHVYIMCMHNATSAIITYNSPLEVVVYYHIHFIGTSRPSEKGRKKY